MRSDAVARKEYRGTARVSSALPKGGSGGKHRATRGAQVFDLAIRVHAMGCCEEGAELRPKREVTAGMQTRAVAYDAG
jgi:hypothetical protein